MSNFIQGLELGRLFYFEAVKPILDRRFQDLNFFGRPFLVIDLTSGFAQEISNCIGDPVVKQIFEKGPIGSIDQFSDSTDILSDSQWRMALRRLYE